MLILDFYWLINALIISLFSYSIFIICMEEKMILSFWADLLDWIESKNSKLYFITYPLGNCEKCASGQISFWFFLYKNHQNYSLDLGIQHCVFVALTILFTAWISKKF